ncbi:MAG: ATP-binding protein [Thermomicrobiales bacterium]
MWVGAYERLQRWLTNELPAPFQLDDQGTRIAESSGQVALREALVNMLVHVDYSESDVSLILRWDGGVRFRNPGRSRVHQPGTAGSNRSDPRNKSLVRMFRLIGWAEEAGTGIPRMIRDWRRLGFEPPEIDPGSDRYEFTITLSSRHLMSGDDRNWLDQIGEPFTDAEQLALVIALREGEVDNQAVRSVTGSHGADVSRVLTGLRDRGFLHMVGSKRAARYILNPQRASPIDGENGDSPTRLVDSTKHSVDSTGHSVESTKRPMERDQGLPDSQQSTDQSAPDEAARSQLQQIAAPVRVSPYVRREDLTRAIVHLCAIEALSIASLAQWLNRTPHHIGQLVRDLVAEGRLEPANPTQRRKQRFKASQK